MPLAQFLQETGQTVEKPASTQPASTQPGADEEVVDESVDQLITAYRVGPGDVLTVNLSGLDATTTVPAMPVRVNRDGALELPAVGAVKVVGLDLMGVEKAIRDAYVPKVYQDVAVNVMLVESHPTRVLVYGAVITPGLVQLRRTERNVLFAVVGAGGVNTLASGRFTIKRLRSSREITLDLLDPVQLKEALALPPLQDGDSISVEAANPNTIFVGGLVLAPRAQNYPPGTELTVLQAIAASGGLRTDVTPHNATLIRRMPDGKDAHVKINLDRVGRGDEPNITLVAGDILWVPETLETRVEDWINRNVFLRVGASFTYNLTYDQPGIDYLNNAARQAGTNGTNQNQQNNFDPLGFLSRNAALQNLVNRPVATPAGP
jgi:protein involved in polysaccharide export with SLBB domain